ncbi:MAG: right-handed parallel beta-helix repeat-containing protein [Lapillicoccus sp.]
MPSVCTPLLRRPARYLVPLVLTVLAALVGLTVLTAAAGGADATPAPALKRCAARPSSCGFPDATNTGVPAGKTLKRIPGDVTSGPGWAWDPRGWVAITGNGAVFDGYALSASISVEADNVTIRNCRISETGESFGIALRHTNNATIADSEIASPDAGNGRLMVGIKDIYGDSIGLRVLRTDITHTSTGIQVESGLIQDNYIHDMGYKAGDHINGTTSNGGNVLLTIRHNTIFNQIDQTDAVSLFQDFGVQANRVIDNNLLAGGGYTIYAGANAGRESGATNVHVTHNRIARIFFPRGGSYGPLAAYVSGQGNTFTGNVWDESGSAIYP